MGKTLDTKILPNYSKWYAGKTVLVTGATSGIGLEIARQVICFGSKVLLCGRNKAAMNVLLGELRDKTSLTIEGFCADLSQEKSLKQLVEEIRAKHTVDILVNNAGFGYMGDFHEMSLDIIDSMQEVNMLSVIKLCREFLPEMKERTGTGILNVGSIASFFPTPNSALYGATKQFVLGFTDALHQEMSSFDMYVTGVYPGKTQTRFLERATGGKIRKWDKAMDPELVAQLALKGLSENKVRVIPGFSNKIKIFIASIMPISWLLKKTYSGSPQNTKKE